MSTNPNHILKNQIYMELTKNKYIWNFLIILVLT
jgi:hypothetical protein